jgi:hypothetical protein
MGSSTFRTSLWLGLAAVASTFIGEARVEASTACQIPGFNQAAFANTSYSASGTTDSWNDAKGAYSAGTACTDPASCTDTNSCSAGIGTNGSSLGGSTNVSGSCTTNANINLPIPTMPTIAPANQLGAISGTTTITGPGNFSATSITESGTNAANFLTASPNGPVVLFVSGNISFSGNGALNNDSLLPSNVLIMCTGGSSQTVTLNGNGNAYFTLYCPQAAITLDGGGSNGQIWGAIVGNSITGHGSHSVTIHYDTQIANMTSSAISCAPNEVSRATPIVATVPYVGGGSAIVQGTYETPFTTQTSINKASDIANFTFPYIKGHMRARKINTDLSTTASAFSGTTSSDILFDTDDGTHIPSASYSGCTTFNGSCRNVFTVTQTPSTTTGVSFNPPTVQFNDTNAATLGPLMTAGATGPFTAANYQSIERCVLTGQSGCTTSQLGGVDRSTVAVIPPSTIAGVGTRPQMVYFGGTDGMLHAVCADTGGTTSSQSNICPSLGTELWAFMPREQLPRVITNTTKIDGSVHVVDAFGDFYNTGLSSFRTILMFQMAIGNASTSGQTPAVYAVDVTDPATPAILWEYTIANPSSLGTFALGLGLTVDEGVTNINGAQDNVAFVQTSNGNTTTGSGVVVNALNLVTGQQIWQFGYTYPNPPRTSGDGDPPITGMPGGAVIIDKTGFGQVTDLMFADLYGDLWEVNATNGVSRYGTNVPLFSFSTDFHPIGAQPALYSNNNQLFAVFTSGGYADNSDTSWNHSGTASQYLVAVNLSTPTGSATLHETSGTTYVPLASTLAAGQNGYAQVLIAGGQLFVTTDSADVNATGSYGITGGPTGQAYGYSIASAGSVVAYGSVTGGAGGLATASSGGTNNIYASSSNQQQMVANANVTTTGTSVNTLASAQLARNLWLRTQ